MSAKLRTQIIRSIMVACLILLGLQLGYMLQPEPVVQDIQGAVRYVPTKVITEREPDAKVGKLESLVMPAVRPDYVARAIGGAEKEVGAFCAYTVAKEQGDTTSAPAIELRTRSVRTTDGFLWKKDVVTTINELSDGTLEERRFSAWDGWRFRANGDSLVFQQPRFPVRKVAEVGVLVGVGVGIGKLIF